MIMDIFSIVPIEVCLDDRLTKTDIRVLIALMSFRGKNTNCVWPKRETLSIRCGLSLSKISKSTSNLVKLGWLKKNGNGGRSSPANYEILVPDINNTIPDSGTVYKKTPPDSGTVYKKTLPKSGTKTLPKSGTKTLPDLGRGKELTNELTNELTIDYCPELKSSELQNEKIAIINLPLNVKATYHSVTTLDVEEWMMIYPAVDVMQELRNMLGWLNANQNKRKTKSGIKSFINRWLSKAQNMGGNMKHDNYKKQRGQVVRDVVVSAMQELICDTNAIEIGCFYEQQ
jgi:hypothetical protein